MNVNCNYNNDAKKYIEKVIDTLKKIDIEAISNVIEVLIETLYSDGIIYVFGNGGSATTASHMQNDFNQGISEYSNKKFKFFCLSDNVATITAIANDFSYDEIFMQQLKDRLSENDVVIAISGGGNSKNIIKAVEYAKINGNTVIGITGFDGGKLKQIADYNLHADIDDMRISEDIHLLFNHLIMSVLKSKFRNENES
ncbi:phosphoheptose isomerase [Synergistales bacterium]|nr:phosphoheptose isomerase [Synergistales bacterium]